MIDALREKKFMEMSEGRAKMNFPKAGKMFHVNRVTARRMNESACYLENFSCTTKHKRIQFLCKVAEMGKQDGWRSFSWSYNDRLLDSTNEESSLPKHKTKTWPATIPFAKFGWMKSLPSILSKRLESVQSLLIWDIFQHKKWNHLPKWTLLSL